MDTIPQNKVIDIHAHILPALDDGAQSIEQSIDMLLLSKKQGVDIIVATPHFHAGRLNPAEFLAKRGEAYNALMDEINSRALDVPQITLGAELALSPDILQYTDFCGLTINNSRYIMLEMPYTTWQNWNYDVVMTIINKHNLIPVMAHIERFAALFGDFSKIESLVNMDVLVQVNARSLSEHRFKKIINSLVKKNKFNLLGSDCHNTTTRRSEMDRAMREIAKRYSPSLLQDIHTYSNNVINDRAIDF